MKNKLTALLVAIAALFIAGKVKAQCVDVDNQLGCTIVVQITLYSSCGTPPTPCSTTPITMTLTGGSGPTPVNCTACGSPCNVLVTLTHANGVPVPNSSADFNTGSPGNSSSVPAPCGAQAWIYYDGNVNSFIIN